MSNSGIKQSRCCFYCKHRRCSYPDENKCVAKGKIIKIIWTCEDDFEKDPRMAKV